MRSERGNAFAAAVNISNASFLTETVPNRLISPFEHSIVSNYLRKGCIYYFILFLCFVFLMMKSAESLAMKC